MSRKFGIMLIILSLLPLALYLIAQPNYQNVSTTYLSNDDKVILLNYAYDVIDNYFHASDSSVKIKKNIHNSDFSYDNVFITVICNGKLRACYGGTVPVGTENRIFRDVQDNVLRCMNDTRYGGVLTEKESLNVMVVFTFLYNRTVLASNDLQYIEQNIELGVHAIEVDNGGHTAFFKESVPISSNYDLEYTLERLCIKAGLDNDSWKDNETKIYKYDTLTFVGNRENTIVDLYRYNILVDVDTISNKMILDSISSGQNWFLKNVDSETHLLEYMYYPSEDTYASSTNHVRQLGSLWAITELDLFLRNNVSHDLIVDTLDYYLTFKNTTKDYAFLTIDNDSKLAYNAFMILILLNTPDYPNRDLLLHQFANGVLAMQNIDGSYETYITSDVNTGVDYYPGEAMLALMKLYQSTRDDRYIKSVEKAVPYYRSYWRNTKTTAFVPWQSQVYRLLYQETGDDELVKFVFEMNDWLIDNYQIQNDVYPDKIGGFPKDSPRNSASSYLEGINAAYAMAVAVHDQPHIEKYYHSLRIGARFILQTQFTTNNSFYLENPWRAIGGFKESLIQNTLRLDYTQHAVLALIQTYENNIFS